MADTPNHFRGYNFAALEEYTEQNREKSNILHFFQGDKRSKQFLRNAEISLSNWNNADEVAKNRAPKDIEQSRERSEVAGRSRPSKFRLHGPSYQRRSTAEAEDNYAERGSDSTKAAYMSLSKRRTLTRESRENSSERLVE